MLDTGPVNVKQNGVFIARRARVIWQDGTLYVVKSASNILTFETVEPTKINGDTWEVGDITFTRRGCSTCSWSLGRISRDKLIA